MIAVVQRVTGGSVTIGEKVAGKIGHGLVILLGVMPEDDVKVADFLAERCATLRIFEDENGKMNRSLLDIGGGALVVSQFTLCADVSCGRRPSFSTAAKPDAAVPLYERFKSAMQEQGVPVECGEFGADMLVEIKNDGPVTIILKTVVAENGKISLL